MPVRPVGGQATVGLALKSPSKFSTKTILAFALAFLQDNTASGGNKIWHRFPVDCCDCDENLPSTFTVLLLEFKFYRSRCSPDLSRSLGLDSRCSSS